MRPGQNKRMRGRNNNRKGPNPLTRSYESNGPDVKIRGTAQHIAEKYLQLARDAQSSGDPVMAESYLQHAEHYFRIIAAAQQAQQQQMGFRQQPENAPEAEQGEDEDDFVDTNDRFAAPAERGQALLNQPQPNIGQGGNPFGNQARETREQGRRENPAPQEQRSQGRPRKMEFATDGESGEIEDNAQPQLPSFITGGNRPANGDGGEATDAESGSRNHLRPRRRRRPAPRSAAGEAEENRENRSEPEVPAGE